MQCETLSQNKQPDKQTRAGAVFPGQSPRLTQSSGFYSQHCMHKRKPGVVLGACNSSVVGVEAGVQDHPGLHSKSEACLRCMGPCLKTTTRDNNNSPHMVTDTFNSSTLYKLKAGLVP